jgi:pimeloyl-ACP methyl ester carboxylesterase
LEQPYKYPRPEYMTRKRGLLIFLALSVAIFACNLHTSAPPSIATASPLPAFPTPQMSVPETIAPITPTAPASLVYQPGFEPSPCEFPVPGGYSPECGFLVVPENRSRADSPMIRLHVAIFRNRSGVPVADPVVHLAGGPGSSSLHVANYMFGRGLDAILDQRDFILFDQRGTGYSQPRLDCPERFAVTGTLLERGLISPGSDQIIREAFHLCHDRLIGQGIDLSAYNSAASADDLNDLRLALCYDKHNLYAVSYGTRLALTLMRDHPESARSAVLDSVYPLQVNLYTALAPNADRAFNVFFSRCAADPSCNGRYPDLRTYFFQLVDLLNANPIGVSMSASGREQTVRVDGGLLIDVLFVGLYNPAVTASMPQLIYDIPQGKYDILRERLALYFDAASALGMQVSVQCAEEVPFNAPEEAYAAAQGVPPQIAAFYPASVQPLFAACKAWSMAPLDPRENLPVSSDIPSLILAGDHDPITPPEWGRIVAQNMSQAYFHEFAGHGHWVTRSSACALSMALEFWSNPTQNVIDTCNVTRVNG